MSLVISESKPCKKDVKCGKNQVCLMDPIFPHRPSCKCDDHSFETVYGECLGE